MAHFVKIGSCNDLTLATIKPFRQISFEIGPRYLITSIIL